MTHLRMRSSVVIRARLYYLRLSNEVDVGHSFFRLARHTHIGGILLSGCVRFASEFLHEGLQRRAGDVAPARRGLS
jgi:hypothetical protein